MPNYNLRVVADGRMLATAAADRESALVDFGKQLEPARQLTLSPPDIPGPALYLLDE